MKQMKFLLVALMTVLMGMSVTSCMNGDDNTRYIPDLRSQNVQTIFLLHLNWLMVRNW